MENMEMERDKDVLETLLREAGLDQETSLQAHLGADSVILLREKFRPWQLIRTLEDLGELLTELLERFDTAVRETGGQEFLVDPALLKKAGISPGDLLDIQAYDGEIYITEGRLPELAGPLKEAGVRRLNISLDTLNPEKYAHITRMGSLSQAVEGIRAAMAAGFEKVKLNTVLIGGFNEDEIVPLAELTRRYPMDLRFIEMMPMVEGGDFGPEAFIPNTRVLEALPELEEQPADGGVARLYRLPGALGQVGLISPVNAHFCAACNRIRLTADGKLKPCLHSAEEYSIKGLNREQMCTVMEQAIYNKPAWHGELNAQNPSHAGRNMNQIGG